MAGEGFDIGGAGGQGASDPGRAAREAADRIAQQVREILQNAEQRAVEIRGQAEREADEIREDAAGAAARVLERADELERQINTFLGQFFESVRNEIHGLAPHEKIEAAAAQAAQPAAEERTVEFTEPEPQTEEPARPFPEPQQQPEEPRKQRRGLLWGRRERPASGEVVSDESDDPEDAHVMALNMALNGTPREETESYLVRRFGRLDDLELILDDVYGRVKRG
jgi:hypothetical protein